MAVISGNKISTTGTVGDEATLIEGLLPIWAQSHDPWCVVDRLGRIRWSNAAMQQMLGVGSLVPADLLLRRAAPDDRARLRDLLEGTPRGETATMWLLLPENERAEIEVQAAMLGSDHALLTLRHVHGQAGAANDRRVAELEAALADIRNTLNSLGIGLAASDGRSQLPASLTVRQQEVTELLLAGMRESEIADALFISEHTVRNHKKAAFRALGVHSMTELMSTYRPTLSLTA